jgi:predicted transcriptional regulator
MYYMATLTLRVPDELDEALQRHSAAAGISKSDLAREALRRFLAVSEIQRLREKLVRRAQLHGVHTDEDAFQVLDRS